MKSSEDRFCPSALIPWIFALVALLGCNSLIPHLTASRKGRSDDGSSLTQVAVECSLAGAVANPLVFLAPDPTERARVSGPPAQFLGIDARRDPIVVRVWGGAVLGRAPPVEWSA